MKDDKLHLQKKEYTGNDLRIDGYYYTKYGNPEYLTIYLFYRNGIILHTGDGWEYSKLNEFEQKIKSADFINNLKDTKYAWGVFNIENGVIKFERWYPSDPPLKSYVNEGSILNDTTFKITQRYRINKNKKIDITSTNEIYYFRKFSPKPDSCNNYIK